MADFNDLQHGVWYFGFDSQQTYWIKQQVLCSVALTNGMYIIFLITKCLNIWPDAVVIVHM